MCVSVDTLKAVCPKKKSPAALVWLACVEVSGSFVVVVVSVLLLLLLQYTLLLFFGPSFFLGFANQTLTAVAALEDLQIVSVLTVVACAHLALSKHWLTDACPEVASTA